ncbi:hypothetical protein AGDE_10753 [Angomonas deanei]|nr:hypothetical protein AGDE_10753 [Angomonas deanei]|eukprot:EPY27464.1 hypothetical protein AGDE_10753 [Angomonas deanei]
MSAGWESPIQVWNLQTSFAEKQVFGVKSESDCIEVIPGTTAVVICSGSIESPIVVVESSQCCVLEKETERLRKAVVGGENPIMSRYCKDSSTLWVLYLHSVKAIAYHTGAVLGSVELPAPGNSITLAPNAVGRAVVACQRGTLAEIRLNM